MSENIAQRVTDAAIKLSLDQGSTARMMELLGELVAGVAELDARLASLERSIPPCPPPPEQPNDPDEFQAGAV